MRLRAIQQFPGETGKHVNLMGEDCPGRSFVAIQVGVRGVYMNPVKCSLCEKELPAWEQGLLPESTMGTIRKPIMSETASDEYRLQCGRVIQTVREMSPSCVVTFNEGCAPARLQFQIKDGSTTLTKANPEFSVSDFADWSPEKLRRTIEAITDGLLRMSA